MGAFNSLDVTIECPSCQAVEPREVQFRYGAVWQDRYRLGDVLRWGRNDVGDRTVSDVVVDAWLCECPLCDHDGRIALYVRDNTLTAVSPVSEAPALEELAWLPQRPVDDKDVIEPIVGIAGRPDEQRRRNEVIDLLGVLAAGDGGVRQVGVSVFYTSFFDWAGGIENWGWCSWDVFTAAEVRLLTEVQKMLMVSHSEAAGMDADGLIASGWPSRISQVAAPALHVLNARGRYSNEVAENDPTGEVVDLHDRRYAPRAVAEIAEGTLVDVTVVCHHPYGMGAWVEHFDQFGHVNVPVIRDEPTDGPDAYPPIGDRLRAVVIGYSGQQLRLTTRRSDLPGLTVRGTEVFGELADATGAQVTDVYDEHERWQVYWTAIPRADLRPLIREAIREGETLVRQIVIETLKYVDEAEGRTWVDLVRSEHDRAYAERRLREWAIVRETVARPQRIADELPELSLWCQRRIVEHATSNLVLSHVAEGGSSKKIRHAAREKLRGRWTGWES